MISAFAPNPKANYEESLSKVLRVATGPAHQAVENSEGGRRLLNCEITKKEYIRYLMMLYHLYATLEAALEKYSDHPVIAPIYNPSVLARVPRLCADISFLLNLPGPKWQGHLINAEMRQCLPSALKAYCSRIEYIANERKDPALLLAHAYVRYLGDLSGGQILRRRVDEAYSLRSGSEEIKSSSQGTLFYEFGQLANPEEPADVAGVHVIKAWFRDGMDKAGIDDPGMKQAVADEAIEAFRLNMSLFSILRKPDDKVASTNSPWEYESLAAATDSVAWTLADKIFAPPCVFCAILVLAFHFALIAPSFGGVSVLGRFEATQRWIGETLQLFKF